MGGLQGLRPMRGYVWLLADPAAPCQKHFPAGGQTRRLRSADWPAARVGGYLGHIGIECAGAVQECVILCTVIGTLQAYALQPWLCTHCLGVYILVSLMFFLPFFFWLSFTAVFVGFFIPF